MNIERYQEVVEDITNHRNKISKGKRRDYTNHDVDVLKNFKGSGDELGITSIQALGNHLHKQMSAIYSYIKSDGQSESEPIKDRISDALNYLELLYALLHDLDYLKDQDPRKLKRHKATMDDLRHAQAMDNIVLDDVMIDPDRPSRQ